MTATDTFTERERQIIAASGRTLASNQRGGTSGQLLRPEAKPQPGDIRPCPADPRNLRALVLRSGTWGPFKRGDGSGMEPGLHYWYEYAMVEPTAVIVEIYRGEAPGTEGIELGEWIGDGNQLDDATQMWLDEMGVTPDNPDLWVNVVPVGEWAPNNRPLAQREMVEPVH